MRFPKHLEHSNLCGWCCQSSSELVALQLQKMAWAVLGMLAGTWPRGPWRCCTENGGNQALVGHGGPGCEATCSHLRVYGLAEG